MNARSVLPLLAVLAIGLRAETVLPLGARLAVCFPPAVPVYGDEIPDGPGRPPPGHFVWSPPEYLADHVSEFFYPALSTRLMARALSGRLQTRLEAYREQRTELLFALADQILALQGLDDATRESELRALAAHQHARIAALEREAEVLRRALIEGGMLQASVDWNEHRRWRIGATRPADEQADREARFQVVRAAAYYENGFTIEQRGLLLELAVELQQQARATRPVPLPRIDDPAAMFFSPALSRFRLPANATARLTALLGRFNGLKNALGQELAAALYEHEGVAPAERETAFAALGERQEPQFAELEQLADEIRVELMRVPPRPLRAGPQIPAALAQELEAHGRDRQEFIDDYEKAVRSAIDLHRSRTSIRPANEKQRAELARLLAEDRIALRARVAQSFRREHHVRYEALRRRDQELHERLKVVATGRTDGETGLPLTAETLLRGHLDAEARFNAYGREEVIYRGYRHAMLLRGLSPEQRRLLFGAARVGLAQPLPPGEPMPTGTEPAPRS